MDLLGADVRQLAGGDIEKMVVGRRIRIVKNPGRIGDYFPDNTFVRQQPESVVHRRLGDTAVIRIHQSINIFGGQMGTLCEKEARNYYPLRSWVNTVATQEFSDIRVRVWFQNHIHLERF
jgi:hypothetical protein